MHPSPIITGGGILPANVAKHQVCNAVLNFVIRFLEGLCGIEKLNDNPDKQKVLAVIAKLKKCVGTGQVPEGFDQLVEGIKRKVDGISKKVLNREQGKLKNVFDEFKNVSDKCTGHDVSGPKVEGNELDKFLNAVDLTLQQNNSSNFATYCEKLKSLFEISELKDKAQKDREALTYSARKTNIDDVTAATPKLNSEIRSIHTTENKKNLLPNAVVFTAVRDAAIAFIAELKEPNFKDGMNKAQTEATKRASAVTEARQKLDPSGKSPSNPKPTYPEFLKALNDNAETYLSSPNTQGNTLAALYYCALCYFKCQQIKSSQNASTSPSSIREMLYFLAALQFSPQYEALDSYVTSHFSTLTGKESSTDDSELKLQVADSGTKDTGNTISAADLKSYLASTFHLAPAFIGLIQEPSTSGEPWLHELFCNSQFNLSYSSGQAILNTLSNCTYALQFQLGFLFSTCANNGMKCGWQECTYGRGVNGFGSSLQPHICPGFNCQTRGCNHKSKPCNHNNYDQDDSCGRGSSPSPLQAFLTDGIQGMCRQHPGSSYHLASCSANSMCHVPMGLQATHLRQNAGTGNHIYSALYSFCGTSSSPLRQLCEKLGCLTKRTPRTLGDLFGFTWHLNGQLFNNADMVNKLKEALGKRPTSVDNFIGELTQLASSLKPSPGDSGIVKSLQTMAPVIPFLYQLFRVKPDDFLPVTLFNLAQHCHKVENSNGNFKIMHENSSNSAVTSGHDCSSSPNDLWSLCQPVKAKPSGGGMTDPQSACRNAQCGGYMVPLTHSAGATYAPVHASVYLSWLAYLTEDFYEWFQNLLDEFKNIDCATSGGRNAATGGKKCDSPHPPGTHGTGSDACSCDSVVHCGGVLPVLYRYGFQFYSPYTLSGGKDGGNETKRDCQKFHNALFNVLAEGAPPTKLLESIDEFLYAIRWEFFSKLFFFWTIYVCIILYTFFFLLDTLRVRSHLHFPSSHSISTISLLGTGKAPALTKLTKLVYYMPLLTRQPRYKTPVELPVTHLSLSPRIYTSISQMKSVKYDGSML
ncbi:uncharacterized protein BcabD6B2_17550 [Babesia caballi]|uniref:C3H1-type domain-containing protein n=1 Tax=Babesia caballi TaxID=5871 RepID=A0AAV4LR20_BABCB|nr:hypothetical protein, conserved [Babesia caballi]